MIKLVYPFSLLLFLALSAFALDISAQWKEGQEALKAKDFVKSRLIFESIYQRGDDQRNLHLSLALTYQ